MGLIKKQIHFQSGSTYNLNILLNAEIKDLGFFDVLEDTPIVGEIQYSDVPAYSYVNSYNFSNFSNDFNINSPYPYTVTGYSSSRLSELEKFVVSNDPAIKYFGNGSITVDGLSNFTITPSSSTYTYYIGGIKYFDSISTGSTATTFSFTITSFPFQNFDIKRIVKLESKQNMVENPQVGRDVFIVRQQQAVFEGNYRLRAVNSLNDTLSYAGGNYFTIYNNT